MVGTAHRTDIVRLRALERQLGERDEKISRQEARLAENAGERPDLSRKIEVLETEVRAREIAARTMVGAILLPDHE
jgi:hypothetical protein